MLTRFLFIVVLLAGGFLAGVAYTRAAGSTAQPEASEPAVSAPTRVTPAAANGSASELQIGRGALPDFSEVAARTVNGVVNISSQQVVRRPTSPFANDPFFRYFFGEQEDMFGWRSRRETSLGSGVIVSRDGYILTNVHVVGTRTPEIMVSLADRRELPAQLIGIDTWTDIALLKVEAADLPLVPWGDSDRLRVAEWVLAVGNPFQLNQTVTLGIVSAVNRTLEGRVAAYEDFIQTDAAINPGNSGGALINGRGELVGINTAIYSETGGYQGIGFAVPSNLAQRVMDDLIRYGEVRRGSIGGVEVAPLTTQLAQQLGVRDIRGVVVWRMVQDSAAYRAGLRPGDVIVSFNGTPVDDASHFRRLLADARIGGAVRLAIIRDGRPREIEVRVSQAAARER
jgi:serine protease Do